jgi:hypothetical protein
MRRSPFDARRPISVSGQAPTAGTATWRGKPAATRTALPRHLPAGRSLGRGRMPFGRVRVGTSSAGPRPNAVRPYTERHRPARTRVPELVPGTKPALYVEEIRGILAFSREIKIGALGNSFWLRRIAGKANPSVPRGKLSRLAPPKGNVPWRSGAPAGGWRQKGRKAEGVNQGDLRMHKWTKSS